MSDTPQLFWYDAPSTLDAPDGWDVCEIGGVSDSKSKHISVPKGKLPGRVVVKISREIAIDQRKPAGVSGGSITSHGYKPADVTITLTMWTRAQWESMCRLMVTIEPIVDKGTAQAVDISHPATAMRGIKAVIIQKIEGPDDGPVPGTKVMTFSCIEFGKGKKTATATPKTSKQAKVFDNALRGESSPVVYGPPPPPSTTNKFNP